MAVGRAWWTGLGPTQTLPVQRNRSRHYNRVQPGRERRCAAMVEGGCLLGKATLSLLQQSSSYCHGSPEHGSLHSNIVRLLGCSGVEYHHWHWWLALHSLRQPTPGPARSVWLSSQSSAITQIRNNCKVPRKNDGQRVGALKMFHCSKEHIFETLHYTALHWTMHRDIYSFFTLYILIYFIL